MAKANAKNQRLAKRRERVAVAAGVPRLLPSVTAVVGPPTVLGSGFPVGTRVFEDLLLNAENAEAQRAAE